MRRREFIAGIGATIAWPLTAQAQQPVGRVYRIGYQAIASREQTLHFVKAFEEGLRSLGYRVGENVVIEYRFADGQLERLPALAADLVRLGVDIIVVVASLARPGGNVTGLSVDAGGEILGKRFGLLKETLPNLSRLGILWNPDVEFVRNRQTSMAEIARTLGLTTIPVEARGLESLEPAFATMARERAQAFVMQGDSTLFNYRRQIAEMALRNRLPAAAIQRELADAGFLLSYGADVPDIYRRLAGFVDKIFKGAKPADLPVEQPTKFELVINLKTAKSLGLTIPPMLLARADEVIE